MFDRRFDASEDLEYSEVADMSVKSVDGIPSISELLDTLNERMEESTTPVEEKDLDTDESEIEANSQTADTPVETDDDFEQNQRKIPEKIDTQRPEAKTNIAPQIVMNGFSKEELEEARNAAFEEGKMEGQIAGRQAAWDEAMMAIEKQSNDYMGLMLEQIKLLAPIAEQTAQKAYSSAVETALAVCRKILPSIVQNQAETEIRSLIEKNFAFFKEEPKITLRINAALADPMKKHITDLVKKEAYAGKIAIIRDESLAAGDCKVEWKYGGLERKTEDILNQTEDLLKLYQEGIKSDG